MIKNRDQKIKEILNMSDFGEIDYEKTYGYNLLKININLLKQAIRSSQIRYKEM